MKVATAHSTTLIQGEVESVDMSISKRGLVKVIKMFRDSTYTHKAWAAVRETIANAVDEHVKHGVTRPVLVSLPTMNDPHFRVRDFAKGLPKDRVFQVFFQYFESTKSESNDSIGGFGIGAKSPLAYAEMFFVDSYHGGMKTSYIANINGEASTAHKMALENSNETGIEVCIPVLTKDFGYFNQLVGELVHFSGWNIEIAGGVQLVKPKSEWKFENKYGKVGIARSIFKSTSEIYANIKGIMYAVDSTQEIRNPFYNQTVLMFDGTEGIEISPSRERIELTQRNIYLINQALSNLESEQIKKTVASLSSAKNARELFTIQFDMSAFRSRQSFVNAGVANKLPEPFKVTTADCVSIEWDGKEPKRTSLRSMFRRNYASGKMEFNPSGINTELSSNDYRVTSNFKPKGNILIVEDDIRAEYVIAYANKARISFPIFCVKDQTPPSNWVEGQDFWRLKKDSVTKEEAKAIRDIYTVRGPRSQRSAIAGREILAYASNKRNHRCEVTFDEAKELCAKKDVILIPMDHPHKERIELILPNLCDKVRLFVFDSRFPLWKKSGLKYEIFDMAKFEKQCQVYLSQEFVPKTSNGLIPEWVHGLKNKSKYLADPVHNYTKQRIQIMFPSMVVTPNNSSFELAWKDAQARWDALTPLQRDIVGASRNTNRTFASLNAEAQRILDAVFA